MINEVHPVHTVARLLEDSRITIPKTVVALLDLHKGDYIEIRIRKVSVPLGDEDAASTSPDAMDPLPEAPPGSH